MNSSTLSVSRAKKEAANRKPKRQPLSKIARADFRAALLFISPWIIGFIVFTLGPMIYSAYLSLTDSDSFNPPSFIGLQNYEQMIQDPNTLLSLKNTLWYTVVSVPVQIITALLLAVLLNSLSHGSGFFRTVFYLPKMTPQVAIGIMFLLLFNGQNGAINKMLAAIGIVGPDWTVDPAWMKPGLVMMTLWTVGSTVVILMAALKDIPKDLYESAKVDGASPVRQFFAITLPLISPQIFFVVVINTIAALQTFTEAYTAFFGSGQGSTYSNDAVLFYCINLFEEAFKYFHMGYASALAWLLFIVIMIVTAIQMWGSKKFVFYQNEEGS